MGNVYLFLNAVQRNRATRRRRIGELMPLPKGFLLLVFIFFSFSSFGQNYQIDDEGTVYTCSGNFYDSGGSGGNYGNNESYTITFCSSSSDPITVDFTDFRTRNNDILHIYDGPTTGSTEIAALVGNLGAGAGKFTSSGSCLTFYFESTGNGAQRGWTATISCAPFVPEYRISDGGTVSTCSGDFYDSGGSSSNYGNNESYTITLCSSTGGAMVADFTNFITRNANDVLHIYDGPTTGSTEIATLFGNLGAGAGTYTSSGTCLTFYFESDGGQTRLGWTATLSCNVVDPCLGLPVLTFTSVANVCEDGAAFNITEASPSGGTYSGTGITSSPEFDPAVAGVGVHAITYTYTDINGCTGSIDQTIEVEPLPTFGYKYATSLKLDAASGSEDLTDFPVLVQINSAPTSDNLRTVSNGGHVENANGYDIVFTDENYSQLDHQIESYDPTTGVYSAWVRIPLLFSSSSTTIYMTYGNAGISTNPSSTDVWISSYKGVWHLNSGATDATKTGNNGAESNTSDISGIVGGGKSFNGSNSFIRINPLIGTTANDENQSLSIWAQYASAPGDSRNFFSIQNPGSAVQIGFRGGNAVAWKWGGTLLADAGFAPSAGAWHYFVYTFDGTTHHLYIDGVDVGSSTAAPQVLIPTEGNLGRYNNGEYFNGWLDEARYSLSAKSFAWVSTEYSNQSNANSFVSFASERLTTDTISVGVCITSYALEDGFPAGGVYSGAGVSGTTFNPSAAGVGTHNLTYTYDAGACTGVSDTKVFIVTPNPSAPAASNVACCISNILDLSATGTNLNWYSDAGLTTNVGFGSPFATGQTALGRI